MDDAGRTVWLPAVASHHHAHRDGQTHRITLPRVDTSTPSPSLPPMQLSGDHGHPSADFAFVPPFPADLARSGSCSSDDSASHLPISPQSARVEYGSLAAIEARHGKRSRVDDDDGDGGESPLASVAPTSTHAPDGWASSVDLSTLPLIDLSNAPNGGPFVFKLYNMLLGPSIQHLISWAADGASFRIHDPAQFTLDVLPLVFKHRCALTTARSR